MTTHGLLDLLSDAFTPLAATLATGACYALWQRCKGLDRELTRLWEALAQMEARQAEFACDVGRHEDWCRTEHRSTTRELVGLADAICAGRGSAPKPCMVVHKGGVELVTPDQSARN